MNERVEQNKKLRDAPAGVTNLTVFMLVFGTLLICAGVFALFAAPSGGLIVCTSGVSAGTVLIGMGRVLDQLIDVIQRLNRLEEKLNGPQL